MKERSGRTGRSRTRDAVFALVAVAGAFVLIEAGVRLYAHLSLRDGRTGGSGALTVLCLGDSWTYGLDVDASESYPAQLQSILAAALGESGVRVINRGVPGATSASVLASLDDALDQTNPGVALLLIGMNDSVESHRGTARVIEAPAPAAAPTDGAREGGFRLRSYDLLRALVVRLRDRTVGAAPDSRSSRTSVAYARSELAANLFAIHNRLAGRGVPLVVFDYPLPVDNLVPHNVVQGDAEPIWDAIRETAREIGAVLADPKPAFSRARSDDVFHEMYFTHPSAAGYRLIAAEAARTLAANGLIPVTVERMERAIAAAEPAETTERPSVPGLARILSSRLHRKVEHRVRKNERGQVVEVTADVDGDGRDDYRARYANGRIAEVERGDLDLSAGGADGDVSLERNIYRGGRLVRVERETRGTFETDFFSEGLVVRNEEDVGRDGTIDARTVWNDDGTVEESRDTSGDGRFDLFQTFVAGAVTQRASDRNRDGRIDSWQTFSSGRPVLARIDRDFDGEADQRIYFDEAGERLRVESDSKRPPFREIAYYEDGRLVRSEMDRGADGVVDSVEITRPGGAMEMRFDGDGDGRFDCVEVHRDGRLQSRVMDTDSDGRDDLWFEVDGRSGHVRSAHGDHNGDGRDDYWEEYENGVRTGSSSDRDFDGRPDRWRRFDEGGNTVSETFDRDGDGRPD